MALTNRTDSIDAVLAPSRADYGAAQTEFAKSAPRVVLAKWSDVVRLEASLQGLSTTAVVDAKEQVTWQQGAVGMRAYALGAGAMSEDGGAEIEIILTSPPATNKWNFQISGAADLEWLYQDSLANEFSARKLKSSVVSATDTEAFDKDGKRITYRPENVVGSYAVYHKTLAHHVAGQTNYASGKVFHVHRPKARDSAGHEVWGTLDYRAGVLSVSVPADFLASAVYPVVIDPTFGYTSVGGSEDNSTFTQNSYCRAYSTPASNGSLTLITPHGRNGGSGRVDAAIYSHNAGGGDPLGDPNARLGYNDAGPTITNTSGWWDVSVTYAGITSGTQYWLAYQMEFINYDGGSSGEFLYTSGGAEADWPDPAETGLSAWTGRISIYGTYTESGGGISIPVVVNHLRQQGIA